METEIWSHELHPTQSNSASKGMCISNLKHLQTYELNVGNFIVLNTIFGLSSVETSIVWSIGGRGGDQWFPSDGMADENIWLKFMIDLMI